MLIRVNCLDLYWLPQLLSFQPLHSFIACWVSEPEVKQTLVLVMTSEDHRRGPAAEFE
jgi:hypothetical protein